MAAAVNADGTLLARWEGIDTSQLHELNREEVESLLEKARTLGVPCYDLLGGKGQVLVEAWVPYLRELSVLVVRRPDGEMVTYPVAYTRQKDNRCEAVELPARPVTVYRFVSVGTVEEQIVELHARKRELAEALLSASASTTHLDTDELVALLQAAHEPDAHGDAAPDPAPRLRLVTASPIEEKILATATDN